MQEQDARLMCFFPSHTNAAVTNQPLCSPLCPVSIRDSPTGSLCCAQQTEPSSKLTFNQDTPYRFSSAEDNAEIDRIEPVDLQQNLCWTSQSVVSIPSTVDYVEKEVQYF